MRRQRTWFTRSAAALAVGALAVAVTLTACGSDDSGGLVAADPGAASESIPLTSGTVEESEASETNSVDTTALDSDEPCVTVVTTIPGQRFCDGYDPFPTPAGDDPNNPEECPAWATEPATRPDGGWLGAGGSPLDYLSRPGLDAQDDHPELAALAAAAEELLPPEYEISSTRALGVSACVDATLTLRAQFQHPDGSTLIVLTNRLIGQYDWSQQPPSGSIERQSLDGGAELATGDYSDGLALRAWVAQPDGSLLRVVAFGANAPTFAGFPTTIPTVPTSEAPTPVPMTLDQVVDVALALAAR